MIGNTGAVGAASILINFNGHVLPGVEESGDSRSVLVNPATHEARCPTNNVVSSRISA